VTWTSARRGDAGERLFARHPLEAERKQDIVPHGHVRVERIRLEDDADVAILGLNLVDHPAVE
jgi:hypothetical protein